MVSWTAVSGNIGVSTEWSEDSRIHITGNVHTRRGKRIGFSLQPLARRFLLLHPAGGVVLAFGQQPPVIQRLQLLTNLLLFAHRRLPWRVLFSELLPLPQARSVLERGRNALLPSLVRLGVNISFDEQGNPHLTCEKEDFSLREVASFFEYTLDVAIRAQRG